MDVELELSKFLLRLEKFADGSSCFAREQTVNSSCVTWYQNQIHDLSSFELRSDSSWIA